MLLLRSFLNREKIFFVLGHTNVGQKILSKIMANGLYLLLGYVGPSEVGFVNGRSAVGNIRKVLAVSKRVKHRLRPEYPILLALDAEIAFDNVQWALVV